MHRVTLLSLCVLAIGCTSQADDPGPDGTEGNECRADRACDGDLVCASGLCVLPPEDDIDSGSSADMAPGNNTPDAAPLDVAAPDVAQPDAPADDVGSTDDTGSGTGEPPIVMITDPTNNDNFAYFEEVEFHAVVDDPEDGPLSGDSVTWSSDLVGELGTGNQVIRSVELGGQHVTTCTAVDSDGNETSADVTITVRSPIARIFHPGDGETRTAGEDIPFVGRGDDAEDGELMGASLVWTSSIDGQFGTGQDFSAPLSAGMNTVTLTVTDTDGNTAQTSITLSMVP